MAKLVKVKGYTRKAPTKKTYTASELWEYVKKTNLSNKDKSAMKTGIEMKIYRTLPELKAGIKRQTKV